MDAGQPKASTANFAKRIAWAGLVITVVSIVWEIVAGYGFYQSTFNIAERIDTCSGTDYQNIVMFAAALAGLVVCQ